MGKPIAGQNQFPYAVGGFLVDGANINGVTYAKKLYIYKQRSYSIYDLQDTNGNIYRNIRIGYQNTSGEMLNYFDVDEDLVETIPVNTFFLKIQDPARNIFSFVRIYQWHKCITVEGDYVFRTTDIDPRLSGVLINPITSTIELGSTMSYKSLFFPSNYKDVDGTWYMNSLDGVRDSYNAQIVSTDLNTAIVKGQSLGKAVLSFVPKGNDALVTHSIINVVQEVEGVQEFSVQTDKPYTCYLDGSEYVLNVVTYPYDAVLTEPLTVKINEMDMYSTTELIQVSDDFKSYTFKTTLKEIEHEYEPGEEPVDEPDYRQSGVEFKFTMNSPIEYEYYYSSVVIASEFMYNSYYAYPGIQYWSPNGLRPNMTWQANSETSGPNTTIYPYVSSDPDIATFDHTTGIITTHNKTGKVSFSTQYDMLDGSGLGDSGSMLNFVVREDVYDSIVCDPQQVDIVNPGEEFKVTLTGYRDGYEPTNIPVRKSIDTAVYTVSDDGNVKVLDNSPLGRTVYIWPITDVSADIQLLAEYKSIGIKPTVRNNDDLVPMTAMETNYNSYYIRYDEAEHSQNYTNIIVYARPNRCSDYKMDFESYDNTIVEVVDKEYLTDSFIYVMGGSLYFYVKALKRGSTEMVINSVSNPDMKIKIKLIVF